MNKPIFIGEVKMMSPYGYKSEYNFHYLVDIAINNCDWISTHTNPLWGGCYESIEYIRRLTKKPILAKGIHSKDDDIKKALDLGANYVLVVDRFPDIFNKDRILIELSSNYGIGFVSNFLLQEGKYVYNGRDLKTGLGKEYIGDYQEYRNKCKWLCGASLIRRPEDVENYYKNCDAFIVGENLIEYCKELPKGRIS